MFEHIDQIIAPDDYRLSIRRYEPEQPADHQVVLLHGVVSHSAWLAPIGQRLAANGIRVIAPDRRGAGLNQQGSGDAPSVTSLLEDVKAVVSNYQQNANSTHFGGFCWGSTYALNVLENCAHNFASFLMLAPAIFPADDIADANLEIGNDQLARCQPNVPIDRFTQGPAYSQVILPDSLRTRYVSPRFNRCMLEMNQMLAPRWAKIKLPTLMILASEDRLSNNEKHLRAWRHIKARPKLHMIVDSEHGVQFDAPDSTSSAIVDWIFKIR
ncbi:MAG: alpha/beta fold hydrolase [Pseudomonadota bacterium]